MTDEVNIPIPMKVISLLTKVQKPDETISHALNRVLEDYLKSSEKESDDE